VVAWSRGSFSANTFSAVALALAAIQVASALNGYPAALADFSTAQPVSTQTLAFGVTLLFSVLVGAGGLGLLAGLAHHRLWRTTYVPLKRPAAAGLAVGLAALGAAMAWAWLRPGAGPAWPSFAAADAYFPELEAALGAATSFIALTTTLLLVVAALHHFASAGKRGSELVAGAFCLGILLRGVGMEVRGGTLEVALDWLVSGSLVGAGLALLYPLARHHHPALIPFAAAVLLAGGLAETVLVGPYPGARGGAVLGMLLLGVGAWLWAGALWRRGWSIVR
jgi:hypothetical protein